MKWEDSKWKGALIWYPLGNWEHGKKLELWYEFDRETICFNFSRALNKNNSWCYLESIKDTLPKSDGSKVVIKLKDEQTSQLLGGGNYTNKQKKLLLSILLKNKNIIDRKRPKRYQHFYHYFDIDGLTVETKSFLPLTDFLKNHKTFKKFSHLKTKNTVRELSPKDVKPGYIAGEDEDWLELGLFNKHEKLMRELR